MKNGNASVFRNPADQWPVTVITAGVFLSLLPFAFGGSAALLLAAAGIMLRALVPIHQHYHSHQATFSDSRLNALYDALLSIGGGNITALWKVHHGLGHHVDFLDQHHDVEGNLRFGENIPFRRLTFTVLGDALSLFDSVKLLKKLPPAVRRTHGRGIALQLLIQVSLLALLFRWNWALTLWIFVVPNIIFRWAVFWFSYGQHDNLPMTGVYSSSTTKFRLNGLLLNVGLHTAHHEKPGLHWSKLARRTEEILPLIHPSCLGSAAAEAAAPIAAPAAAAGRSVPC